MQTFLEKAIAYTPYTDLEDVTLKMEMEHYWLLFQGVEPATPSPSPAFTPAKLEALEAQEAHGAGLACPYTPKKIYIDAT